MADLGVRPLPGRLVAWVLVVGITAMLLSAWNLSPWVAIWVWGISITAMICVGLAAMVARAAWLHRFTVFTHGKANVDER